MGQTILLFTDTHSFCGVGQFNYLLSLALREAGYRLVCFQRFEDTPLQHKLTSVGVEFHWSTFDPTADPTGFAYDEYKAVEVFSAVNPDLIFFSNGHPQGSFAAQCVAQGLSIPYVVRDGCVGKHILPEREPQLSAVRSNYLAARNVVCNSNVHLDVLRAHLDLPKDFGSYILSGVPDQFFEPIDEERRMRLRREWGVPDDGIVCFTAAMMAPVKGHDIQLEAIDILRKHRIWSRLRFVWAGQGRLQDRIFGKLSSLGVTDQMLLLGHVWIIPELLDASDIFVLTSHYEGLPRVLLEAMAKGLPIIATPVGAIPEVLGDVVHLLLSPEDQTRAAMSLAQTIILLAEDKDLRTRIGQAGRQKAEAHFRWGEVKRKFLAVVQAELPT